MDEMVSLSVHFDYALPVWMVWLAGGMLYLLIGVISARIIYSSESKNNADEKKRAREGALAWMWLWPIGSTGMRAVYWLVLHHLWRRLGSLPGLQATFGIHDISHYVRKQRQCQRNRRRTAKHRS